MKKIKLFIRIPVPLILHRQMNKERLNILFISGWYPNRTEPFLGNFVQKHAEAVAMHSDVCVLHVCSDPKLKNKEFEMITETINNIFTVNVYYQKVTNRIPGISQLQKFSRYLKAHKIGIEAINKKNNSERKRAIDLIHLNILWPAGLFVRKYALKHQIPYIITEHSTVYLKIRDLKKSSFEISSSKKIAQNASFITPVSADLQESMISLGLKGNYEVVNNVVDTKIFYPEKKGTEKNKFRFLHISTLIDDHKNISGMIRAVAKLSKKNKNFEFKILGDGDTRPHIAFAERSGVLNKFIFFDGEKTTGQVAEEMRNADCFLMFSNYENMPVVIIEAFASGIPVLSSNVGGISEQVNEKRGLLVEAKNEDELITAMEKMMHNVSENKYDKDALHRYAAANFSCEKICEHFHEIYFKTLGK